VRDVRERRLLDSLLMQDQARALDKPLALVTCGFSVPRLGARPTATTVAA
jgi:hypothetical protein